MWKDFTKEKPVFDRLILTATKQFGLTIFTHQTILRNIDREGYHFSGISNHNWRPELWMYVPEIPEELLTENYVLRPRN